MTGNRVSTRLTAGQSLDLANEGFANVILKSIGGNSTYCATGKLSNGTVSTPQPILAGESLTLTSIFTTIDGTVTAGAGATLVIIGCRTAA